MEPTERFHRQFQLSSAAIRDQISDLSSFANVGGERQDAIEHILTGISRLSNEVADASDYVPTYDQKTYSQGIKALTEELNAATSKMAPKSRFQFKPRTVAVPIDRQLDPRHIRGTPGSASPASSSAVELRDSVSELPSFGKNYNEMAQAGGGGIRKPSFSTARDIAISGQTGLHIILPSTASRATSAGSLASLKGCIVDMTIPTVGGEPFASLTLKDIENSLIVAGRVSGSVHITGVRDSIIVVTARQVRIHECANVDIYLHCASHPIIEDCRAVRFAPLPAAYATEQDRPEENKWDQVDDFKWLKTGPSPNWSVLPDEERLPNEIWKNTVPGAPGLDVDDILKKVGVNTK